MGGWGGSVRIAGTLRHEAALKAGVVVMATARGRAGLQRVGSSRARGGLRPTPPQPFPARGTTPAGAVVSTACNPKLFHLPLEGSEPVNGKGPAAVSDALTNVFATGDQDKRVVGEQGGFAGMCRRACINVYACTHVHERVCLGAGLPSTYTSPKAEECLGCLTTPRMPLPPGAKRPDGRLAVAHVQGLGRVGPLSVANRSAPPNSCPPLTPSRCAVWASGLQRPLFSGKAFFKRQVTDLSWTTDGYTLLACSADGGRGWGCQGGGEAGALRRPFCNSCRPSSACGESVG